MRMIVICSLLYMQLILAMTAVVGLVWGTLYLIRCVNIARKVINKRRIYCENI